MDSDDITKIKDRDKTVLFPDTSRNNSSHPDDTFFFLKNKPESEIIIPESKPLKVGRGDDQDFVIKDQTVSREHLVLLKKENVIHILVKGTNGLVVDGYKYRSGEEVSIRPPKSFEIGGITASVRSDDTVILHQDDLSPFIDNIDSNNNTGRIPSRQPQSGAIFESYQNTVIKEKNMNIGHSSGKSLLDHDQRPSGFTVRPAHESFAPKIKSSSIQEGKDRQSQILLFSGSAVFFLVIVITFFIWKHYSSSDHADIYGTKERTTVSTPYLNEKTVSQPDVSQMETEKDRYDKSLIDRAETLMRRKEWHTAKDYLLDIPKDSIYYDEARQMISKINRMTEG